MTEKSPCIAYYDTNVPQPLCLLVNYRNGDGEMVAAVCEELIAEGRCPKGKRSLTAKEVGMVKKSMKRHDKALKKLSEK